VSLADSVHSIEGNFDSFRKTRYGLHDRQYIDVAFIVQRHPECVAGEPEPPQINANSSEQPAMWFRLSRLAPILKRVLLSAHAT